MVTAGTAPSLTRRCVALVRQGLGIPAIAETTGLSTSRVGEALRDPTGEGTKQRKHRRSRPCLDCGELVYNSGSEPPLRCHRCAAKAANRAGRQRALAEIRHWADLYGEPPSAVDWNMAHARAAFGAERLAELRRRHADYDWPHTSGVVHLFGSWNAAIAEAGFEPRPPYRPSRG
jgi:hypothetical protein